MYLIIHSATEHFEEKKRRKKINYWFDREIQRGFSWIRSENKTLDGGKELFQEKNYCRTGVNTDDNLSLNTPLKFPTLTIIIRRIFQKGKKFYSKMYLDEWLYELVVWKY